MNSKSFVGVIALFIFLIFKRNPNLWTVVRKMQSWSMLTSVLGPKRKTTVIPPKEVPFNLQWLHTVVCLLLPKCLLWCWYCTLAEFVPAFWGKCPVLSLWSNECIFYSRSQSHYFRRTLDFSPLPLKCDKVKAVLEVNRNNVWCSESS